MTVSIPKPEFKFGEAGAPPKTVLGSLPAEVRIVNYTDPAGKDQTRMVAIIRGQKGGVRAFIFPEKIDGSLVLTPANEWFNKAFVEAEARTSEIEMV